MTSNFKYLFDTVKVINLKSSHDRRAYIESHLYTHGVTNFSFQEAISSDDALVAEYYAKRLVQKFPPCFRCGNKTCDRPACNNVLIPAQVANFLSHLAVWREAATGKLGRVLILEDDVAFTPNARKTVARLADTVASGRVPFAATDCAMLRLGWGDEGGGVANIRRSLAENVLPFRVSAAIRMANPCYAMTPRFAQKVVARFERIDTTSDIFLHQRCKDLGDVLTIFPKIASELSSSKGTLRSLIHPKAIHAEYLRGRDEVEAANGYLSDVVAQHRQHIAWRPLLIVGHPRCGSAFAADLCRQLGLDVGHERVGPAGTSSWMLAVDDANNPYAGDTLARSRFNLAWDMLVMHVRDLREAIPSVVREHAYARPAYEFLRHHILKLQGIDLDAVADPFERAAWSIIAWSRIILDQRPDFVFRIEDQAEKVGEFVRERGLVVRTQAVRVRKLNANKRYQGTQYPKHDLPYPPWPEDATLKGAINWYNQRFGYPEF